MDRSKKIAVGGFLLIFLGILMPCIFDIYNMGVYEASIAALSEISEVRVMEAALRLWALNIIRALPHYLGAFLLADNISFHTRSNKETFLKCAVMSVLILLVYQIIEVVFHIEYDLGVPAISAILILIILVRIDFRMVPVWKKAIVVFFLLCAVQCLDIMPILGGNGFGRGETSQLIKGIAEFLEMENSLNFMMMFLLCVMLVNFILYVTLIGDENHIKRVNLEKEIKSRELMEIRMKALEARTHMEVEQLVHDLKTPLTSILTLVGVLKLGTDKKKQEEYLNSIEASVENLGEQISEILDEERFASITIGQFMNGLEAQISHMHYGYLVHVRTENPECRIRVNRVRFYRMLVNLIENAYYAVDSQQGRILCTVRKVETEKFPMIEFLVEDNGMGMTDATVSSIFETGFSTRGSSGLGMNFVKSVVECHGGTLEVKSALNHGTQIRILIPEGEDEE